ncbi:DUF2934 domain-containing protein [Caballeronia arvi]|nr:DUF2934 domain-containing protein [Caballeronia arvi]
MPTALSADDIRVRAYLLWEGEGRQSGRAEHYWREAIVQLERERVSGADNAGIGLATASDASTSKPAKRSATMKVGRSVPANVGRGNGSATNGETNGEKNGEKSRKMTGERQKKTDIKPETKADTKIDAKVDEKANTKTEAKAKVKKKADAPAAASKQPKKSRRITGDTGQAQTSEAP